MPEYLSPGVYVEEVPPLARPIAGVGTSTAGFIGIFPVTNNERSPSLPATKNPSGKGQEKERVAPDTIIVPDKPVKNASAGKGQENITKYDLPPDAYPVLPIRGTFEVRVAGQPEANATLKNESQRSLVEFKTAPPKDAPIEVDYVKAKEVTPLEAGVVKLCTSFSDFRESFGDFSIDSGQQKLAHAVFGFFNNGGTRCHVVRQSASDKIASVLEQFEAIDEIAIVAAPGVEKVRNDLADHCRKMEDRFAILESKVADPIPGPSELPQNNSYAALYFPWIKVFDPATRQNILVPPSGHLAGIYARVDSQRGVHKAPANEAVAGALGLQYNLSKSQQDGLNPQGINCIRNLNGTIYVWGARTLGGNANGEFKYISTRRLLNFLRESIEEGTRFVVFEPNNAGLWQRIKRSVGDFLLGQWRAGALFGETPDKAFFVKCDAETNPPDVRERGEVITEIGVAIVKPAEFVIFRIQQQTGG